MSANYAMSEENDWFVEIQTLYIVIWKENKQATEEWEQFHLVTSISACIALHSYTQHTFSILHLINNETITKAKSAPFIDENCVHIDRLTHIVLHAPPIDFNLWCRLMFCHNSRANKSAHCNRQPCAREEWSVVRLHVVAKCMKSISRRTDCWLHQPFKRPFLFRFRQHWLLVRFDAFKLQ